MGVVMGEGSTAKREVAVAVQNQGMSEQGSDQLGRACSPILARWPVPHSVCQGS